MRSLSFRRMRMPAAAGQARREDLTDRPSVEPPPLIQPITLVARVPRGDHDVAVIVEAINAANLMICARGRGAA